MKRLSVMFFLAALCLCLSCAGAEEAISFTMDGIDYTLPFALSELFEAGWSIDDEDEVLSPGSYTVADTLRCGRETLSVQIINLSQDDQPKVDCFVGQITFSQDFSGKAALPNGLSLASDREQVLKVMGEPSDIQTEGELSSLAYTGQKYDRIVFTFSEALPQPLSISLRSFTCNAGTKALTGSAAMETMPAFPYEAPEDLGGDLLSFRFRLEGSLYQLPIPYAVCLDSDWFFAVSPTQVLAAGETLDNCLVTLPSGKRVEATLYNPYDKACAVTSCVVSAILAEDKQRVALELPGKVGLGSAESDLTQLLSDQEYAVLEDDGVTTYELTGELTQWIAWQIQPETGDIERIFIMDIPETIPDPQP